MTISLPTYTGETTSLVMLTGNFLLDALILGSKWGTGPGTPFRTQDQCV